MSGVLSFRLSDAKGDGNVELWKVQKETGENGHYGVLEFVSKMLGRFVIFFSLRPCRSSSVIQTQCLQNGGFYEII